MTTLFAYFDKHCYELRLVEASPVSDPCSGETFRNWIWQEQICEEEGRLHLHWASVRSVVCRPGRGRTRKNAWCLGRTRWWETHTAALELAFATKVVSQAFDSYSRSRNFGASRVARSRCWNFYQAGAAIGLIWCGLGGIGAICLPQKKSTKNHWIAGQCTFKGKLHSKIISSDMIEFFP